jgi:hypothetical protein
MGERAAIPAPAGIQCSKLPDDFQRFPQENWFFPSKTAMFSVAFCMREETMSVSKEQLIQEVARKAGPGITVEAKMEKGIWRVTLTREGKSASIELKRGFVDDYFESGEYQQEIAFENRINKALREFK